MDVSYNVMFQEELIYCFFLASIANFQSNQCFYQSSGSSLSITITSTSALYSPQFHHHNYQVLYFVTNHNSIVTSTCNFTSIIIATPLFLQSMPSSTFNQLEIVLPLTTTILSTIALFTLIFYIKNPSRPQGLLASLCNLPAFSSQPHFLMKGPCIANSLLHFSQLFNPYLRLDVMPHICQHD